MNEKQEAVSKLEMLPEFLKNSQIAKHFYDKRDTPGPARDANFRLI